MCIRDRVERVFVHKFENLVNGLGQGGIDVDLPARFAGDFRVGVGVNEDFALGVTCLLYTSLRPRIALPKILR